MMDRRIYFFRTMTTSSVWVDFARAYGVTPICKPGAEAADHIGESGKSIANLARLIK